MINTSSNVGFCVCAFAQSCIDRFGRSVMADVINAGIDPHRWFAGVMNKIITADLTHKDDPEWVKKTNAFLEEHVSKKQRQDAKAAAGLALHGVIHVE